MVKMVPTLAVNHKWTESLDRWLGCASAPDGAECIVLHEYLGDVEDVHHRAILEPGQTTQLPILYLSNISFFPGRTTPLHFFMQHQLAAINRAMQGSRIIGLCHTSDLAHRNNNNANRGIAQGVAAEIISIRNRDAGRVTIVAQGRYRFRIVSHYPSAAQFHQGQDPTDGTDANVVILDEGEPACYPVSQLSFRPAALRYSIGGGLPRTTPNLIPFHAMVASPSSRLPAAQAASLLASNDGDVMQTEPSVSQGRITGDGTAIVPSSCTTTDGRDDPVLAQVMQSWRKPSAPVASISYWPAWVTRYYDPYVLRDRALALLVADFEPEALTSTATSSGNRQTRGEANSQNFLGRESDTSAGSATNQQRHHSRLANMSIPENPIAFSYWLASNLPVSPETQQTLQKIDTVVERLRKEIDVIANLAPLCCSRCLREISSLRAVVGMSSAGFANAFVNSFGVVHDTITCFTAQALNLVGQPSLQDTWFPGYAWQIAICSGCYTHIGWHYTATQPHLQPRRFWGLSRANLIDSAPAFGDEDNDALDFAASLNDEI
ncbi:cereblon [Capsaspora owczarzaki ATCC 30864]|uniref:cereblon n=1 Tax=Capsaspora owczarzaki (strain ATCC 30864) TaxID=595528 RepID=UPI0003522D0F|nr:cereblon [Capsaspora owczarzaki ATCC 30864]|eukprot:XP_004349506.2 cereblon [Capsaspora owczarzaki ATCC 30864]